MHDGIQPSSRREWRATTRFIALGLALTTAAIAGAAEPPRVTAYDIHVRIDPSSHMLHGTATLTLGGAPPPLPVETATVEFALNRALKITKLTGDGVTVREHTQREPATTQPDGERDRSALLTIHRLTLAAPTPGGKLTFEYSGELVQDVQAGERPGQIHNLMMAAHIGPEGIFLDGDGGWYPSLHNDDETVSAGLADFRLTADPVEGMTLVAGAAVVAETTQRTGKLAWHSKYPLDSLALVGGPHQVKDKQVGAVHVALHYALPTDADVRAKVEKNTELFLAAAEKYLDRYPPLIGPYPFDRFTIVENFFSSGFAFPEFTLLNKVLLEMGPRALMHGYLDHELLHAWWGNSIYVDPADGNWCEALTSYAANYYGYILDGDEAGARNQRRNYCVTLSSLKPDEDKPLGRFGRDDGPSRDVGYGKGAMVFHMLARRIGQDNFWTALRRLTAERTGKYADWRTLRTLFEEHGNTKLDRFFAEWVQGAGTPRLRLSRAAWLADAGALEVTLTQEGTAFELSVPLRIVQSDNSHSDHVVDLQAAEASVRIPLPQRPATVVLDPDYQVLRKLEAREIVPTSKVTAAAAKLLVVKPAAEVSKFNQRVIDAFRGDDAGKTVTERTAADVTADELRQQSVLVLGEAVRSPAVQSLLSRAECPVTWTAGGFRIGEATFDQPGQSVLVTIHHPDLPGGGLTVYFGNSEDALGRSDLLMFYRSSLVIFETTFREADGEKTYESRVLERRDFESPHALPVQ
jgi:hypothetical protein